MATTTDGFELVYENTSELLDEISEFALLYRTCSPYTPGVFSLRFEVLVDYLSNERRFKREFKTEEAARAFFNRIK